MLNLLGAFHSKGFLGYTSEEAQKQFADSLLRIADKMFWAPMAYLGVTLYQNQEISVLGFVYIAIFFVLGIILRHNGLKVYDLHDEKTKIRTLKQRLVGKNKAPTSPSNS